ncbi:hypothetical protein D5125_16970 [Magnetovirga frankeli]|uniref:hypothetical protein n=1 Tax=Magnetovirga frankeli TaxID=947516 RepID=UPI0012938EDE|nr:hypothetical protein D5125_16970 [gamma proteobacterium SS-5]
MELPNIDDKCGLHFSYRDFIECSDTWKKTRIRNVPQQIDTYRAIERITQEILDPVQEYFGKVNLTYGFSSPTLVKEIKKNHYPNITPSGDQHSGSELNKNNKLICDRRGIAVDFYVGGVSSLVVACWVAENTNYDRLYFYSPHSPFHVSVGPENNKAIVYMKGFLGGRHQPYIYSLEKLKVHNEC